MGCACTSIGEEEKLMDPKIEDAAGRVKEAAGALTGNEDLKAEGAADQASAHAKEALNDAADKAKGLVEGAAGAVDGAIDALKDKLS
jgi:uncharacterized protein YjbJ (UPF0337 family)